MKRLSALLALALTLASAHPTAAAPAYVAGLDAYDLPYFPIDVQLADLNGDLRPDLVALCQFVPTHTTSVWIQLNLGDGTFAAGDTTAAEDGWNIALEDIDGDGTKDVVVGGAAGFEWFHGNGDGTLGTRHDLGSGPFGTSEAVVFDVDSDNDRDVVVAAASTGLELWRNLGAGTFAAPVAIALPKAVSGLLAGRWNADPSTDLAVRIQTFPESLAVLLNDGTGGFALTQIVGAISGSAMFAADADRDGDLDVLTSTEVFPNTGSGAFLAPLPLDEPCVAAGDLEPDGPYNELLSTSSDYRLHVRKHLADPPLGSALVPQPVAPPDGQWRVADLDGDGTGDAVAFFYSGSAVTVYHGRGLGAFGNPNASPVPGVTRMSRIRANGDAFPDVVTIGEGYAGDSHVVPGVGPHAFGAAVTLSAAPDFSAGTAVGDVDGDAIDDVVLARLSGGISVFLGNGDGTYDAPVVQPLGGQTFTAISAGDLDGDGRADIAGFSGNDSVAVALAGPGGVFGAPVRYPIGWFDFPALLQVVEATGDSHPDVVVLSSSGGQVAVLPGAGNGTIGASVVTARNANATPRGFALGRLDGDTVPDLAITTDFGFERLLGSATGAFTALPLQRTVRGGTAIAIADLDLDGNGDVVMTSGFTFAAHVYVGDGTGALAPGRGWGSGGVLPLALVVADMDGNGRPDLILGNQLSSDLSVLLAQPALDVPPPTSTTLALAITPNPSAGALTTRFSLPRAGDTRLELMDLQGRRVVDRALGLLTAGPHTVPLDGARLPAGLYWVRLRHPDVKAAARVIIVR